MAAADFLTWDGDSGNGINPRRPSTDDVGGDNKQDDPEYPPDPDEHFTADGWNQKAKQIPALAKVAAACKLRVRFTAGAPAILQATGPRSTVAPGIFTVTDNGVGDTSITWAANYFPAHVCSPTGFTFIGSATPTTAFSHQVEEITNGIRVRTFDGSTPTDLDFALEIN